MFVRASAVLLLVMVALSGGCVTQGHLLRPNGVPEAEKELVHKPDTYAKLGDLMMEAAADTKNYSEARREELRQDARLSYRKAIEVSPSYAPAHAGLARLELFERNFTAAEQAFTKALELEPKNATLWAELAYMQLRRKQWPQAAQSLTKAVEQDPTNKRYASMLGYTQLLLGQTREALEVLAKAEGEAMACVKVGRALHRLNRPEEAQMMLAHAERFDPNLPALHQARKDLTAPAPAPIMQAQHQSPAPAPAPAALTPPPTQAQKARPADDTITMPDLPVFSIRSKKN